MNNARQEIYDRIRQSSKEEFVLEEMIRHGFWPAAKDLPEGPESDVHRMAALRTEIRQLTYENRKLKNVERIRRQQRLERLKKSREQRKANKERRVREKAERAEAWKQKKNSEIGYLGKGYSSTLSKNESDKPKLISNGLDVLHTPAELAAAMKINLGLLRFLAFSRKTSNVHHYRRFTIPKKTGGERVISAPMPRLKTAQRWVLDNVLCSPKVSDAAHGFRNGMSIVSNAQPHVGAKVVVNMDMKDFFPTVTYPRVKGLFRNLGYSGSLATVFALLCTQAKTSKVGLDNRDWYVAQGERFLPQGAPTSPAITNLICRGLDSRVERIASKHGFVFTRYADDMSFSSKQADADAGRLIRQVKHVVRDEGFEVHPDKTRVIRSGRRLEVTGLTVNEKVGVSRKLLRKFRATLHQIEKDGPEGKQWGSSPDVITAISGFANFVSMVDAEKGAKFQAQIQRIIEKHGFQQAAYLQRKRWAEPVMASHTPPAKSDSAGQAAAKKPEKKKGWWKLW
jgi:retron-type reverse transcriptase